MTLKNGSRNWLEPVTHTAGVFGDYLQHDWHCTCPADSSHENIRLNSQSSTACRPQGKLAQPQHSLAYRAYLEILCVLEKLGERQHLFKPYYLPIKFRCHCYSLSPWAHQVFVPKHWQSRPKEDSQLGLRVAGLFTFVLCLPVLPCIKLVVSLAHMGISVSFSYAYFCLQVPCFY